MKRRMRAPALRKTRTRAAAGFWTAVLSVSVLLPLAGLSDRWVEAPADRRPAVVPETLREVDSMLREALAAMRMGHYEAAVWASGEVLRVEPSNVAALQMQGSAFFFMNERGRAKAVWRRALELDPGNEAVSALLKRI